MRKEYDFSKGERGKFFGKVDTKDPLIETDNVSKNSDKLPLASASGQENLKKGFSRIKKKNKLSE